MKNNNNDKINLKALDLAIVGTDGLVDPQYFRSPSRLKFFYNTDYYIANNIAFQNRLEAFKIEEKRGRAPKRLSVAKKKPVKTSNFASAEAALCVDEELGHSAFEEVRQLEQLVNGYVAKVKISNGKSYKHHKGKPVCYSSQFIENHVKTTAEVVHEMIRVNQSLLGVDKKNSYCQDMKEKYDNLKEIVFKQITRFEDAVSKEMESQLEQALKYFKTAFKVQNSDFAVQCYQKCIPLLDEFSKRYPWFGDIYYYRAKAYYETGEYYTAKSLVELVSDYWQFNKTDVSASIINELIKDINKRGEEMWPKNSANRPC